MSLFVTCVLIFSYFLPRVVGSTLSLVTLPNLGNCNVLLLSFAGCLLLVHCQANLIEKKL